MLHRGRRDQAAFEMPWHLATTSTLDRISVQYEPGLSYRLPPADTFRTHLASVAHELSQLGALPELRIEGSQPELEQWLGAVCDGALRSLARADRLSAVLRHTFGAAPPEMFVKPSHRTPISASTILTAPRTHTHSNRPIAMTPLQRAQWILADWHYGAVQKEAYLRRRWQMSAGYAEGERQ